MLRQEIITAPPVQPISLEYAKKALKLDVEEAVEDDLLAVYISAAADFASSYTGIMPVLTTVAHYFTEWSDLFIFYQAAPLLEVVKIEYMAAGATTYTELAAAKYALDPYASPPRVKILKPDFLPTVNTDQPAPIKITFKAGYRADGTNAEKQEAVPAIYKQAVALMAAHWYLYRADYARKELPSAAQHLLNTVKVNWF
tara:strand:- start:3450 stop:4046 length:597 start_codon:yes stop_codon:yes gene_type:complete